MGRGKPVAILDEDYRLLQIVSTMSMASKKTGIDKATLERCLETSEAIENCRYRFVYSDEYTNEEGTPLEELIPVFPITSTIGEIAIRAHLPWTVVRSRIDTMSDRMLPSGLMLCEDDDGMICWIHPELGGLL